MLLTAKITITDKYSKTLLLVKVMDKKVPQVQVLANQACCYSACSLELPPNQGLQLPETSDRREAGDRTEGKNNLDEWKRIPREPAEPQEDSMLK